MTDSTPRPRDDAAQAAGRRVEMLASRALSMLARRKSRPRLKLSETFVTRLHGLSIDPNMGRSSRLLDVMREAQIGDDAIVDEYVPEVARRLGVDWVENRLSFAEVTMGAARLQAIVRDLHPAGDSGAGERVAIAVYAAPGENHTLGATVAAHQLRRLGVSVRLTLDGEDPMQPGNFDAVFVSVATTAALVQLAPFVENLRQTFGAPVVVGGPAVERAGDAKGVTRADHATTDCKEALRLCGLETPSPDPLADHRPPSGSARE